MKEWALAHPYLAFFLGIFFISFLGNVIDKFISLFKKPINPVFNIGIPVNEDIDNNEFSKRKKENMN